MFNHILGIPWPNQIDKVKYHTTYFQVKEVTPGALGELTALTMLCGYGI